MWWRCSTTSHPRAWWWHEWPADARPPACGPPATGWRHARPRIPIWGGMMTVPAAPLALLAELTHRCPLRCPYCSNPTALTRPGEELDTATWARIFREAAELGCLQVHLSGGEPTARRDILDIVRAANEAGL